ncbi:MAG: hypothetical protein HYZ44_14750 [Bacteroidetes bacterium]|nr:hypothetical protein [Bacteroidota bacterium]
MACFSHTPQSQVIDQLDAVANMTLKHNASCEERLLMEIRHRIGGDGSIRQINPGTLGQNPLAYLNAVRDGDPDNSQAEFRGQLYFVYMSKYFADAVLINQEFIQFFNREYGGEGTGRVNWSIDQEFVVAMNARGPQHLPPMFRYGSNAAMNGEIRTSATAAESADYDAKHPSPTIAEVMGGSARLDQNFMYRLGKRELMNEIGDFDLRRGALDASLHYISGGRFFRLRKASEMSIGAEDARKYAEMTEILCIPTVSGVSGTLDLSTTMAGLVGLGIHQKTDPGELEKIRLAYLAFMIPNKDHTVHEIMQSSKTYGCEYVAGPGYEQYIYPADRERFIRRLQEAERARGVELPSYYLSAVHARAVSAQIS